ncbi:MAG: hypothetical protein ACOCPR_04915 [Guyparkeria sp.]
MKYQMTNDELQYAIYRANQELRNSRGERVFEANLEHLKELNRIQRVRASAVETENEGGAGKQ